MQENNYLSLNDVASLCGCKQQNISKKINKYKDFYKPYIYRNSRRVYISKEAVDLLKTNAHNNQAGGCEVVNNQKSGCNTSKSGVVGGCEQVVDNSQIEDLKQELKTTKEELKKRNERIDELTDELLKINKAVAPLIAYYGKGVPLEDSIKTHLIEQKNTESIKQEKQSFKDRLKKFFS